MVKPVFRSLSGNLPENEQLNNTLHCPILMNMAISLLRKLRFGKKIEIKEQDRVTLPVILGIKPPVYLGVLYGIAVLMVLFLIFVNPGLSKPGSIGIFTSEPQGAAVRIDDVTLGYTPCKIFIPKGKHTLEFVLPGFTGDKQEVEVTGRLFASLFFPSKISVTGNLVCQDPVGALAGSALEYMYWAASGEPTEGFQNPLSLSEGIYRVGPLAKNSVTREAMQGILDNSGISPSSLTVLHSLRYMVSRIAKSHGSSYWLAEILPGKAADTLMQSAWSKQTTGFPGSANSAVDISLRLPASLNLEGMYFILINPGYLEKYGQREIIAPMLVARFPVSREAWDIFTAENTEWEAINRENLVKRGLAGEEYLYTVETPGYPEPAVPGISWHAAKAYCAWLNTKLPAALPGWEIRLPSEVEWEYAVRQTELDTGLLWEWCDDPYAPLDFFPVHEETLAVFEKAALPSKSYSIERLLRGGSWINPSGSTGIESRGSLPPETSSPFVGFRPVIVPKQGY